jgi:hypothetical protein
VVFPPAAPEPLEHPNKAQRLLRLTGFNEPAQCRTQVRVLRPHAQQPIHPRHPLQLCVHRLGKRDEEARVPRTEGCFLAARPQSLETILPHGLQQREARLHGFGIGERAYEALVHECPYGFQRATRTIIVIFADRIRRRERPAAVEDAQPTE